MFENMMKLASVEIGERLLRSPPPPGWKLQREIAQARRDVRNPAWRAWAKLKPLTDDRIRARD